MCITNFCVNSNPHFNTMKLAVLEVHMLHENTELLPSVQCYDLSSGNNDPTEVITLVLVGIPDINQTR